jgi:CHAD domain-containing protein
VLIERLRAEVQTLDCDREGGDLLVAQLEDARERSRDKLLGALGSPRYFELLDAFAVAVAALPEVQSGEQASDIARAELRDLREAAAELPPEPTDDELHNLRITAKRARYGAELVASGHKSKPLQRYLEALKHLQDVVGEHQDAVVAEATVRKLARKQTAIAAGRLIACERLRRAEQRRLYPDALAAVLRRGGKALG